MLGYDRLVSQFHTMDPDDSSTSRGVRDGPFAFQLAEIPSSTPSVISPKEKGRESGR